MRKLILWIGLLMWLGVSPAYAASYLDVFEGVHDPILQPNGFPSPYAGQNLEPGVVEPGALLSFTVLASANLSGATLNGADLGSANLSGANLSSASLRAATMDFTDLRDANLTSADLTAAELRNAKMSAANLSFADFSFATFLGSVIGVPQYNAFTNFAGALTAGSGSAPFDPVSAGWILIPEPSTALLVGLGLLGIATGRRPGRAGARAVCHSA